MCPPLCPWVQGSTTTTLNGAHHLELPKAYMSGVAPRRAKVAEDIRDFKLSQRVRSAAQL